MPTDIAMALTHNVPAEKQTHSYPNGLIIVCLWSVLGLVFTALMFKLGFDPALVQSMAIAG